MFRRKANGKNVFEPADGTEPILVAERNSMHAMDGDRVQATMMARRRNHVREALVTEIVERADHTFVGTLEVRKDYAYLLTEDRTLANDIFIPKSALKKGKDGDKAVVKITEWPENAKNPVGQVIDILGRTGENNAEMHAILAEYGLPYKYPSAVEKAAEKLLPGITAEEISKREDMREVMTFTIDPRDAKDFDDALSIRPLEDGLWEVGVHIADVSHYVTEGSIIDREAQKRSTSVYLVDRTIPMLPERLCNYICSLRPDEDKLASSNICSNEALCALTAGLYMATMGPDGMADVARQSMAKAHYLAKELCAVPGVELAYTGEYFHEFVTHMPRREAVLSALAEGDILGGLPVGEDGILWCATEKVSRAQLDKAVSIVKEVLAK